MDLNLVQLGAEIFFQFKCLSIRENMLCMPV